MAASWRQFSVSCALAMGSVFLLTRPRFVVGEDTDAAASTTCIVVAKEPSGIPSQLDCGGKIFVEKQDCNEAENQMMFSSGWWTSVLCCFSCITCAACAAGLTLGLTSIEEFDLKVLMKQDPDGEELYSNIPQKDCVKLRKKLIHDQQCAGQILPIISGTYFGTAHNSRWRKLDPTNEHYLLVTLLLANATANEALPLFLDKLVSPCMACLLSVSVVLIFGEIIPSAVFTGPSQLTLAARMSCIVRTVKFLLMPIAWPLSIMLDRCLGHGDEETYTRSQIKGLIRALRDAEDPDDIIDRDEANMMHGVLELHYKTATTAGHDIHTAKMLADDTILDMKKFEDIDKWGHSRVFVFRRSPSDNEDWGTDITGVLLLKKLLTLNPKEETPMHDLAHQLKRPILITPTENLLSVLNKFQEGHSHMALVTEDPEEVQQALDNKTPIPEYVRPTKFITLEDVIEELLNEEIYDEEDLEVIERCNESQPNVQSEPSREGLGSRTPRKMFRPSGSSWSYAKQRTAFADRWRAAGRRGDARTPGEDVPGEQSSVKRAKTFSHEPCQRMSSGKSGLAMDFSEPLLTSTESTDTLRRNVSS